MGVPWIWERFPSCDVLIICVWVEGGRWAECGHYLDRRWPGIVLGVSSSCPPVPSQWGCSHSLPWLQPERLIVLGKPTKPPCAVINTGEKIIEMEGYRSFCESFTNPGFKRKEHWPGSLDLSPSPGSVAGSQCPLRQVLSPRMPHSCFIYQTGNFMCAHPASQSCPEAQLWQREIVGTGEGSRPHLEKGSSTVGRGDAFSGEAGMFMLPILECLLHARHMAARRGIPRSVRVNKDLRNILKMCLETRG